MTKYTTILSALLAMLCADHSHGFLAKPLPTTATQIISPTTIAMTSKSEESSNPNWMMNKKVTATSAIAAAFLFSNVLSVAPAFAAQDENFAGSSQVVAARSGGRMGGRSSMGNRSSMGSRGSYARPSGGGTAAYSRNNVNNYSRTTVIRPMSPSPVIIAPSPFGFGLSPFGGFGMGYGFGGGIGDSFRDYGQDREIARDRTELEEARIRSAQLEQRLAQLEQQQGKPQQVQQQQQPPQDALKEPLKEGAPVATGKQ